MKKKSIVFLIAIAFVASFVGFASSSFAESKRPPAIAGVVTEINGTTLTLVARDKNVYTVDASNAKVVTGFLGFWAKLSSFSNIQVTDTLAIIGDINGTSISATEIADNKTPKNAQANANRDIPNEMGTSTSASTTDATATSAADTVINAVSNTIKNIANVVTGGTSTPDISSSTPDDASTTASSTDLIINNDALSTATTSSVLDNVINSISDTVQNVVNAVTGGTSDTSSTDAPASTTDK